MLNHKNFPPSHIYSYKVNKLHSAQNLIAFHIILRFKNWYAMTKNDIKGFQLEIE